MFFVYILESEKTNGYYIGYTENLEKRIRYHNRGLNKSTRSKGPWEIVYEEAFNNKTDAIKRERFLKKQKNRQFYERLISGYSSVG